MYIKLIFSQSVVWSGNIFSSVAIFLIIALGTSGYFSIVMIFWLHILKNHCFFFFWLHCIKFHVSFVYKLSIIIKQMICLSSSNLSQSWLIKDSLSFNMHRRREKENNQYHICCCVILTISLFILAWNTLYVDGVGSNLSFQIFKAKLKLVGLLV